EAADEAEIFAQLAKTQRAVDPAYYPGVKGARGIFKVKPVDVERSALVGQAVAGEEMKAVKVNAVSSADFLIKNALKSLRRSVCSSSAIPTASRRGSSASARSIRRSKCACGPMRANSRKSMRRSSGSPPPASWRSLRA